MPEPPADFSYFFAALHVRERDAAVDWYTRLFGRAPNFLPTDDEAVWQVAETASLYVLVDGDRVGDGEVTLVIDDLDHHRGVLAERQIVAEAAVVIPGAGRKARVRDPDGNMIWFLELTA